MGTQPAKEEVVRSSEKEEQLNCSYGGQPSSFSAVKTCEKCSKITYLGDWLWGKAQINPSWAFWEGT